MFTVRSDEDEDMARSPKPKVGKTDEDVRFDLNKPPTQSLSQPQPVRKAVQQSMIEEAPGKSC